MSVWVHLGLEKRTILDSNAGNGQAVHVGLGVYGKPLYLPLNLIVTRNCLKEQNLSEKKRSVRGKKVNIPSYTIII